MKGIRIRDNSGRGTIKRRVKKTGKRERVRVVQRKRENRYDRNEEEKWVLKKGRNKET